MKRSHQIYIHPDHISDDDLIQKTFENKTNSSFADFQLVKKSIDARKRPPHYLLTFHHNDDLDDVHHPKYQHVEHAEDVIHIIGAGPAGYFAALKCLELGIKPIVIERGKDVQERRKDLRQIQQFGKVHPHSNYCFGEGGAGTYSDGKLYTRSKKRGSVNEVLDILIDHGAKRDIRLDAHPHIGSNKLPVVIQNIRKTILDHGGEIRFNTFIHDFKIENNQITHIITDDDSLIPISHLILATGHSGREMFHLLNDKTIKIEAKEFALGVRVEHPQPDIDKIQYGQKQRHDQLPASKYTLTCQVDDQGVYSFCMCPGGFIVPASTADGELVINGMSLSRRDSPFANSGIVTTINEDMLPKQYEQYGELKLLKFQSDIEKKMYSLIPDGSQMAPAQRLDDFIHSRISKDLPKTSYIPGIFSAPLHSIFPEEITKRLQDGFRAFDQKMKGFVSHDAIILAVESRTSSPIKIPRDDKTLFHPEIANLYPCGEGAGYAGGIMSAAIDGQRVVTAIKSQIAD